jgi:transposase
MANKNISMSKVKQIIRLHMQVIGKRKIAQRVGISKNTVRPYIAALLSLRQPLEDLLKMSDHDLHQALYPPQQTVVKHRLQQLYDFFPEMDKQLRKRGMTVGMEFRRYRQLYPQGFRETSFYKYYNVWKKRVRPTMHIEHKIGDKMYVDFAGDTLPYVDADSGELCQAQVFVAILGWSQYAYVEAMRSQTVEDLIAACEHSVQYFKGSPLAIVPDNLKSAVTKASRYEPDLNTNFNGFAEHYGMTVLPARVRKPQDKAHVENLVKLTYQRIYTGLPEMEVLTLDLVNQRVRQLLEQFNRGVLTGRSESRYDLWLREMPTLQKLADQGYQLRTIRQVTVMKNGHVLLHEDRHYYSVPYTLIGRKLQLHYCRTWVELYHNYEMVARHKRVRSTGTYTTEPGHLSSQHQYQSQWNPAFFLDKAKMLDPVVEVYIGEVLHRKPHPEQAYKSCQGILLLAARVGEQRLINACKRAHEIGYYGYRAVEDILRKGLDRYDDEPSSPEMPSHHNIRGSNYYQ